MAAATSDNADKVSTSVYYARIVFTLRRPWSDELVDLQGRRSLQISLLELSESVSGFWSTEVDFQIVVQLMLVLVCLQISCTATKKIDFGAPKSGVRSESM